MKIYLFILSLLFCAVSLAQTTITGTVTDGKSQPVPGANIKAAGDNTGTVSGSDGKFTLTTQQQLPFTVEVSSVGFGSASLTVSSPDQDLAVTLSEQENQLNEIVVSASRTPERVLQSPVTIERMNLQQIKNTTAATFYDGLENLKEVHFNTSSIAFKSINTRGFATVANTRFMQLVDGMDNSSPALNFVLGNLIGVSEIDVANVELLPGASSALYGANAFNGILFMNSKSPFMYQGITTYVRYGNTSQDVAGTNDYWDVGIRAAKAFTSWFAAKANFTVLRATEWIAADQRNVQGSGILENPNAIGHEVNTNYDGLNIYGDEVTTFIPNVGQVSRTGYFEEDLNSNKIKNYKADFSLHFKPFKNDVEIILQSKIGTGNTIYQGANRYSLKNFYMNQNKFEVKGDNFFARVYMTDENAGDSYDMRFAAINVNRLAKSDTNWFTDYARAYQLSSAILGYDAATASGAARRFADTNMAPAGLEGLVQNINGNDPNGPRFNPGSPEFKSALASVISDPNLQTGAKFIDQSRLYHSDLNYNFKDIIKVADVQVGGSWRQYEMNSEGTIFTDYDGPIRYDEYGAYLQLSKKFMDDRFKLTGSARYDKSENFDGFVSPRVALVYSAGANKQHNFRVSYQTGFRNPTTQDQYIGLDLGPYALIGSAPENLDRYVETRQVSVAGVAAGQPESVTLTGQNAYNKSYTTDSVDAFLATGDATALQKANIGLVKPERVQAFELGYRSIIKNDLTVDINGYYNIYNDFINESRVYAPYYGDLGSQAALDALQRSDYRTFQVYSNSRTEVTSIGFGVGVTKKIFGNFEIGANYNYAEFDYDADKDPSFIPGFNTPKHRVKGSLGNDRLFRNFGFNANVRWSTEYLWQSSFVDGYVPENTVIDAQINYTIPSLKSTIKVGANNLFGDDYIQVIGAGAIGQQWFASLTINP